jgi:hypothetical protein
MWFTPNRRRPVRVLTSSPTREDAVGDSGYRENRKKDYGAKLSTVTRRNVSRLKGTERPRNPCNNGGKPTDGDKREARYGDQCPNRCGRPSESRTIGRRGRASSPT